MLRRVLGVERDSLDDRVITDLVTNAVVEHQRLEYKSQLPDTTQDGRREFARYVAAMANGGGGVILLGVRDDANDVASEITPVQLGAELTRLSQICNSLIEPFLPLDLHDVQIGDSPGGVVVVEVPRSPRVPFAVAEGSRLGYYRRTGRNRHPLAEAEVAALYQGRGIRVENANQRLQELIDSVSTRLGQDGPPAVYVAVVPLDPHERLFRPDRETIQALRAIRPTPVFGTHGVGDVLMDDIRPAFKRIEVARRFDQPVIRRYGWMEFHDDGAYLGVIPGDEDLQRGVRHPDDTNRNPGFYDTRLTCQVVARLAAYGLLAGRFDVQAELMVAAGVADVGLPAAITTGPERFDLEAQVLSTPVRTLLSADIGDLTDLTGLLPVAAPLLDDLMSAFGRSRCFQLDRDGTIRVRFWGGSWTQSIRPWAEANGLATSEEG